MLLICILHDAYKFYRRRIVCVRPALPSYVHIGARVCVYTYIRVYNTLYVHVHLKRPGHQCRQGTGQKCPSVPGQQCLICRAGRKTSRRASSAPACRANSAVSGRASSAPACRANTVYFVEQGAEHLRQNSVEQLRKNAPP